MITSHASEDITGVIIKPSGPIFLEHKIMGFITRDFTHPNCNIFVKPGDAIPLDYLLVPSIEVAANLKIHSNYSFTVNIFPVASPGNYKRVDYSANAKFAWHHFEKHLVAKGIDVSEQHLPDDYSDLSSHAKKDFFMNAALFYLRDEHWQSWLNQIRDNLIEFIQTDTYVENSQIFDNQLIRGPTRTETYLLNIIRMKNMP